MKLKLNKKQIINTQASRKKNTSIETQSCEHKTQKLCAQMALKIQA
jgi:hypothetical protein